VNVASDMESGVRDRVPLDVAEARYITPLRDDPELGSDLLQNDDFSHATLNPDDQKGPERCPFAAHTRKTNPRGDLAKFGGTNIRRILRHGIQYGPELTYTEKRENRTIENRGLLIACYQSNIFNGFRFIQERESSAPLTVA
jgi:deferrochelatase/peroxidase EfeB